MGTEEKIDRIFLQEIEACLEGEKFISLPLTIKVEQDDMPDVERWRKHE